MSHAWLPSPEEISGLPRWCQVKMTAHRMKYKNLPKPLADEYNKWANVVGEKFFRATHHYCAGLNWLNRYRQHSFSTYKGAKQDRQFALKSARGEFQYMRERTTPKYKLYYLCLMQEAYANKELKNYAGAIKNYQQVIKLKPGYAIAYVEYAGILNSLGKNQDALKILQIGLKKTKGDKVIEKTMAAMKGTGS